MGYFSNGSQGMDYEYNLCSKCRHGEQCMVWLLHLNYNYDQFKDEKVKSILDMFIPQTKTGNDKCRMYIPKKEKNIWRIGVEE
jgi:hypothetical protein